jgi:hypothetical protein
MRPFHGGLTWVAAALLGGGILYVGACARPVAPSGGPVDFIPPMIAETWPDTFEMIEPTRDPVKIVFSERISERPTEGTLENAVFVSPVTGEHRVKHTRSGLEIEVIGGFQPDLVYRVRVLPTVKDLFNNRLQGPFELVFTTGAPFEFNVVAGVVSDRITGEVVEGARVEARAQGVEDAPIHVAATDTAGVFALRYLPAGPYDISAYVDNNRNAEREFREAQGSEVTFPLGATPEVADTAILREITLLVPDTTPSRLARIEPQDSLLIRFGFDDFMDAEANFEGVQVTITQEDGPALEVERYMWPRQVDSIRAIADSIAAEERRVAMVDSLTVVADSLDRILIAMEAQRDTVGVDTLGPQLERIQTRIAPPEPREPEEGPAAAPSPILPQQEFFVQLADSLTPERLYTATVTGVVNLYGTGGGGGEATFDWEPPEPPPEEVPDTAAAVADTLVVPDTAAVGPDTLVVPDTVLVVPPDTAAAALPDSLTVPPDTSGVPPDTSGVPPDTSGVPPDTFWARHYLPAPTGGAKARRLEPLWWLTRRAP